MFWHVLFVLFLPKPQLHHMAVFYLLFCAVQIFYLFLHLGTLPAHLTYAEYVHRGFFQLLFVVFINLALVLCILKYFRSNRILKGILILVSACTYIMIASAAYRLLLYIAVYHLTLLRLLVLWFLALTAVLMAGVLAIIFKETFPLCRYCIVTISVFYTCFALARPDSVIARYNLTSDPFLAQEDLEYLATLSLDAVPMMERYLPDSHVFPDDWDGGSHYLAAYLSETLAGRPQADALGIRTYNFSVAHGQKVLRTLKNTP